MFRKIGRHALRDSENLFLVLDCQFILKNSSQKKVESHIMGKNESFFLSDEKLVFRLLSVARILLSSVKTY